MNIILCVTCKSHLSDLTSERNAFWDKIYPEIQDFCQSLGLVFEVVDFRWGVSDSVINDHMTVELCLQEIQLCQKLSVGPSFLALVGSQYGHRPIPRFISENEFELLLSKLSRKDQEGSMLLRQWFIKDSNSVPPKYVLQPINVVSWNLTEARLLQLLCTAALEAEKDGEMSAEQNDRVGDGTGFPQKSQDNPSAVIFVRDLPPLKKSEQQKHTLKFLDVTADGLLDKEAQELLTKLKERIHSACADDPGFHHIELSKGAIDRKEHKEYLENFCKQIVSQLKGKISRQTAPPAVPGWLWLQQELLHHANLSKKQCAVFCGRDGLLGKICLVMWESLNMQHGPLVVSGPPGSGKTAVLCRLAQEMRAVLGPQAVVTLRLLGTSPLSSDVDSVLKSVCVQVCGAFNLAPPCTQTANSHDMLVRFFQSMLHKVSEQGDTLLLILDSLDHLPHANGGHKLRWLPKEIPPNIHLVVSTLADWSPCLESLKALNNDDKYFFQVEPLTLEEGQLITKAYMDKAGRRLTSEQVDAVLQSFQKTGSPLHLKLLLDMAKQWTSYTTLSDIRLGSSVQEVISLFLDSLEGKHGKLFVRHALGYITLSRFGLSEAELQDILSLDNDVLAEVYQNRLPPNHTLLRFPPLLWALFRQDLGDHLVERWENGIAVQFIEIVKERYLSVELRVKMHTVLSEYFLGQWSQGQQKPILLHPLMTQLNADRKVPAQPLWFAEGIPNFRKLHELPFHLLHAGKWEELRQLLLGNLEWLYCKTLSCGVASVIQDFTFCTDVMDCPEIRLIRECFLLLKPTIDFIDGNIDSSLLCTEITARFQALAHAYPDLIGCLYSQCQDWFASCADPVLVPRCSFMEAPGGALKNTLNGFTKGVTAVDVCCEKSILTAGSEDGLLIVWDLKHLEVLHTFVAHTGVVECVKLINKGDQCLSAGRDGCIKKWSVCSGKQLYCIQAAESILPRTTELLHVLESRAVLLFSTHSQVSSLSICSVWGLTTGQLLDSISGVGSPVMFISVYNNTIISASPSSSRLKLWSLDYDPKHRNQMCVPANCTNVVITKDGSTVHYIKEEDRSKVFTWSCAEGELWKCSDVERLSSNVCCMELAQQKRLLFCGLRTGTIFIYPLAFAQETLCIPPPESMPEVRSMAISPREDRMAVAYEDAVCLFEITARDSFPCVEGPLQCYSLTLLHSPVSAMALLPDCRLLYGTLGGEVAVYDFKSATAAELDHHGAAITCVALSNWDTHALIGSEDCNKKKLYLFILQGFYFEGVLCAAFSVNDKHVFTGSRDKTIKVWDVATGSLLYIQYVYAAIIRITPFKDGFVAVSQFGSLVKESFRCPDTLSPDYNPLRNFRAHYRVTSREKILEPPHTSLNKVMNYNPAQFNFVGMFKTKQSNTCVIL
uniref:NACHT and WD repeat domain containing 1 n=1 Tax=Astyanax mexicanus TaxID=7994 RepID=A0A3B1K070_ASTMX